MSFGKQLTQDEFINKAKLKHNDYYDYSLTNYNRMYDDVIIICPKHGEFKQKAVKHIIGHGCIICKCDNRNKLSRKGIDKFIIQSNIIHGNRYDYSTVVYANNKTKINIICKDHGSFLQTPDSHLRGRGCPKCLQSQGEKLIESYLKEKNIKYINEYRFPNCKFKKPLPFDFYLPDNNTCIEFDGIQHFKKTQWSKDLDKRQMIDKIKTDYCQLNNIRLIRISYLEKDKTDEILHASLYA